MDWREQQTQIRKAIEDSGSPGPKRRVPLEIRKQAVAYFEIRHTQGLSADAIGRELGVAGNTIRGWISDPRMRSTSPLRAVEVVQEKTSQSAQPEKMNRPMQFVVHGPCSTRVEGLDLSQIAELLRRLG